MKTKSIVSTLSLLALGLSSVPSIAGVTIIEQQGPAFPVQVQLEAGVGFENNQREYSGQCNLKQCGESKKTKAHFVDENSQTIIHLAANGLIAEDFLGFGVRFLKLSTDLSPNNQEGSGFGHVDGFDSPTTTVRRAQGILLMGNYKPENTAIQLKGVLADFSFDREKGFWEVKFADLNVGIVQSYQVANNTKFDIDASVGSAIGLMHFDHFKDLQKALGIDAYPEQPMVADLEAALEMKLNWDNLNEIKVKNTFTDRIGLSKSNSSQDLGWNNTATAEAGFTVWKSSGQSPNAVGLFTQATYEIDSTTLSSLLLKKDDTFQSLQFIAGMKAQF